MPWVNLRSRRARSISSRSDSLLFAQLEHVHAGLDQPLGQRLELLERWPPIHKHIEPRGRQSLNPCAVALIACCSVYVR